MIQPYIEFREPTRHEIASASEAIVDSYIAGPDHYDLHRFLGEVLLERMWAQARDNRSVPYGKSWETTVYECAVEIASKWSPMEWALFRGDGA